MSKVWLITGSSRGLGTRELLTVAFSVAPVSISRPQSIRLLNYLKTVESAPLIPKKRRFSGPSLEPSWNQFCRCGFETERHFKPGCLPAKFRPKNLAALRSLPANSSRQPQL